MLARRRELALVLLLLFGSALPDAMIVPVLEELMVRRYGVRADLAHLFMAANLIGGLCAVPLLALAVRRRRPLLAVGIGAAANAVLIAVLRWPIGFEASVALRVIEGVADVVVFAVVFDLLGRVPRWGIGLRFGVGSAVLSAALGCGAIAGGVLVDRVGAEEASVVFLVGAASLAGVSALAFAFRGSLRRVEGLPERPAPLGAAIKQSEVVDEDASTEALMPAWSGWVMAASDRAIGGLLIATLPLFLAEAVSIGPRARGLLLGLPLLMMAVGTIPAGWLADRSGAVRLRLVCAVAYALGLLAFAMTATIPAATIVGTILLGVGGAGLLPTSLALVARGRNGISRLGGFRVAGDLGFFLGVGGAALALDPLLALGSLANAYIAVIVSFAVLHLIATLFVAVAARHRPGVR